MGRTQGALSLYSRPRALPETLWSFYPRNAHYNGRGKLTSFTQQQQQQNPAQTLIKKTGVAHLGKSLSGHGTECRVPDLKRRHRVNHKGACLFTSRLPLWAFSHVPPRSQLHPRPSHACIQPSLSVLGTSFATPSCSKVVDTRRPGLNPTQVSSAHL